MNLQKAKKTKQAVEAFFYKSRYNLALNSLLESKEYKSFLGKLESAIYKQILYFAKVEKVNQIVGVSKAVKTLEPEDFDLMDNIRRYWIPILAILEEDEFFRYLSGVSEKGGQFVIDRLKSGDNFVLTNSQVLGVIKDRVAIAAEMVDTTTQSWIARTVAQGMKQGFSHLEIAKTIRDMARKIADERASVIVENETANGLGEITDEIYRRSGIVQHSWLTQRDEMTCDICMANEAAGIIRVGEAFPNGVFNPPAHPRCRCIDVPVIPENMEEIWTGK